MTQPFFASRISGIGSAFPAKILTNDELSKTVDTADAWIQERTGIRERRIAEPLKNPAERNSALGARAALQALQQAGKKPDQIDAILYATCSGDTPVPSTACWLQNEIGATRAWAMDLNAACSGFVFGTSIADQFIRTGSAQTILVVGAEVLSSITNWEDRGTCILFGDGAGAAIVERTTPDAPNRILWSKLHSDGRLWDLFQIEAGGSNRPNTPETLAARLDKMQMKGREIFKEAVRTLADFAVEALESNGMKPQDLDWFVPHQANLRIIEAVAKRLQFPMERVLVNVDRFGNTSAATVPTALAEGVYDGRVKPGQTVLMDVFGAGLTYGSLLMRWG